MKANRFLHPVLNLGTVCLIFAISVILRWDYINRPLTSHHHTWLTGHVLLTLDIWDQEGPGKFNYTPIYTYNNPGDRYNHQLGGMPDSTGRCYYVSYPPFCFIAPYAAMKLTGSSPSGKFLTWFNLLLSLVCCILILLIVYEIFNLNWLKETRWETHLSVIVYLFSPVSLWFHSNVYFADMMVQPLWIAGVYFMIRYLKTTRWVHASLMILSIFLASYTEWLGLFAGGIISLIILVHQSNRQGVLVYLASTAAIVLSLGMFFYQYSAIDDFGALFKTLSDKYALRSGMGETEEQFKVSSGLGWQQFNKVYNAGHEPLLKLAGWLAGIGLLAWLAFRKFKVNRWIIYTLLTVTIPSVIHHVLFFNFTTTHDFSALKGSVTLALVAGISVVYVLRVISEWIPKPIAHWSVMTVFLALTLYYSQAGFKQFQEINDPLLHLNDVEPLGRFIARNTNPEDGVCLEPWITRPQTSFLAKRNTISQDSIAHAKAYFSVFGVNQGVYIKHLGDTAYQAIPFNQEAP